MPCFSSFQNNRTRSALTLIELLAVLAILALLAGVAVAAYDGVERKQETAVSLTEQMILVDAINNFYADGGRAPTDFSELVTLPSDMTEWSLRRNAGWRGPYIDWNGGDPALSFALQTIDGVLAVAAINANLVAVKTRVPGP